MNIVRNAGVLVLGLLPLVIGCVQPGEDMGDELGVPLNPQGGGETHGNGYKPEVDAVCQDDMLLATNYKLVVNGQLNPLLPNSVKPAGYQGVGTGECSQALKYAFACAGAQDAELPGYTNPKTINGEEIMNVTDWRDTGGLSWSDKLDVFSCMTAHLNHFYQIPICMEGPQVTGDGDGYCGDDYPLVEAVWVAIPDSVSIARHVWAVMPEFTCGNEYAIQAAIQQRTCDGVPGCNITVHSYDDLWEDCVWQEGWSFTCFGYPAVTTWLTYDGYETLYPRCEAPGPM